MSSHTFWQDCADMIHLLNAAPAGVRDDVACAIREFLLERDIFDVLDEAALLKLQAVRTADDLKQWVATYELPPTRGWGSMVIPDVGTLLERFGVD